MPPRGKRTKTPGRGASNRANTRKRAKTEGTPPPPLSPATPRRSSTRLADRPRVPHFEPSPAEEIAIIEALEDAASAASVSPLVDPQFRPR